MCMSSSQGAILCSRLYGRNLSGAALVSARNEMTIAQVVTMQGVNGTRRTAKWECCRRGTASAFAKLDVSFKCSQLMKALRYKSRSLCVVIAVISVSFSLLQSAVVTMNYCTDIDALTEQQAIS
eukprot:IDg20036t1